MSWGIIECFDDVCVDVGWAHQMLHLPKTLCVLIEVLQISHFHFLIFYFPWWLGFIEIECCFNFNYYLRFFFVSNHNHTTQITLVDHFENQWIIFFLIIYYFWTIFILGIHPDIHTYNGLPFVFIYQPLPKYIGHDHFMNKRFSLAHHLFEN